MPCLYRFSSFIGIFISTFSTRFSLSDDKGILPDYIKNIRIGLLDGIRTNTFVVFLVASTGNGTFVVLTINHGVIKLR